MNRPSGAGGARPRPGRAAVRSMGVLACALLLTACATTQGTSGDPNDPFEDTNRQFHAFNNALDEHVLEPVADAYVDVTPVYVRNSVGNFFNNISYPGVVLNDLLQGKVHQGIQDTTRFVVNSTIGIAGLWDPASAIGLPLHDEDFGQTLGVWGAGEGAYLEIPFFGPNSTRDAPDLAVSRVTNVLFWVGSAAVTAPLAVLDIIDTRARLDTAIKLRDESALDSYVFTREAYRQRRTHLIYDGNPPLEEFAGFEE